MSPTNQPTEHTRFRGSFKDHVETAGSTEPGTLRGLDLQAEGAQLGPNKTLRCVAALYVDFVYNAIAYQR